MRRRGISRVDGRLAHDGPALHRRVCAGCGGARPASGLVRRVSADGQRVTRCYGCYERATGGSWRDTDEYWDGACWVPLREGK